MCETITSDGRAKLLYLLIAQDKSAKFGSLISFTTKSALAYLVWHGYMYVLLCVPPPPHAAHRPRTCFAKCVDVSVLTLF